jgi:hypothetical protein
MAIRKFRTGQMSYAVGTYVGTAGTIFYDEANGALRISDGVTPGGSLISYPVASTTQLGGIKLGPGVELNSQGQIIIDSEGLDFSFGDFEAITGFYSDSTAYALLSSINADEDVVIASNGDGSVKVVGQFDIYKTNGTVTASLEDYEPFFRVKDDGQVRMLVPAEDPIEGAVEIVGSASGSYIPPGQAGAMLQITGNPELPARVYLDGNAEYASFVARRFNGTVAAPTAVLANQDVFRINATAATSSGMGGVALGQIRITALENQTTTAQGSKMVFTVTPIGSAATSRVDVATISVADGVSATKFTGPLTGNVTGNVSGTAGSAAVLTTARNINGVSFNGSADITVTAAAGTLTGTTLNSTVVTSSLTTVGTLGSLTVTNLVTAKNYSGQVRNLGTITAGAGTEITIDFATDHMVRFSYSTEPVQVAFTNYSAGKTVTLIAINTSGTNRRLEIGIAADNTQGVTTLDVDANETAIVTYYCTGTTVDDVFASTVYTT